MAKMKCYVVYDSKVEAFMQPFFCRTAGEALRNWEAICNDGKSMMSLYPADYTLFETAEYDESTGRFSQYDALKSLSTGVEVQRSQEKNVRAV